MGCKAGLSLKPSTPVEASIPYLAKWDLILVADSPLHKNTCEGVFFV